MRDYLSDFLTPAEDENLKTPKGGKAQKAQKSPATFENTQRGQGSKGSKGTFDTFDTSPPKGFSKFQAPPAVEKLDEPLDGCPTKPTKGAFDAFVGDHSQERADFLAAEAENTEMHDSSLLSAEPDHCCPICHAQLCEQNGKQFVHRWCSTPGHFNSWRAKPGHKLGESPLFDEWRGKGVAA